MLYICMSYKIQIIIFLTIYEPHNCMRLVYMSWERWCIREIINIIIFERKHGLNMVLNLIAEVVQRADEKA